MSGNEFSKWIPSVKVVAAGVAAGAINVALTQDLDWRSGVIAFGTAALAYWVPELRPSPSAVAAVERRQRIKANLDRIIGDTAGR